MRDLKRYQADYQTLPFEAVQLRYRRKRLLEDLGRFNAADILEVGCGMEPLFLHLDNFRSMHLVEPSEQFHANALAAAGSRTDVTIHYGTLEEVAPELKQGMFDSIILSSLLHELAAPMDLLHAAHALCAPHTVLHINVPNANSLHRLLALEMGLISDVHDISETQRIMQQSSTYDARSLTLLLQECGFELLEMGSFFVKPFTHAQMASLQEQGLMTETMLDGLYRLSNHLPGVGSELFAIARRKNSK